MATTSMPGDLRLASTPEATVSANSPPTRRVIAVMEHLARDPFKAQSLTEVATGTGINRATCLAVLTELLRAGWLVRDPAAKTYRLGPSLLRLGSAADDAFPQVHLARRALDDLHRDFRVGCAAAAVRDGHVEVVHFVGDPGDAGRRRVPFAAPFGSAFVAWSDHDSVDAWLLRSGSPVDDDDRVWYEAVFASLRRRHYGVDGLNDAAVRLRQLLTEMADDPATGWMQPSIQDMLHQIGNRVQVVDELRPGARFPVNVLYAPVFGTDAQPVLNLSMHLVREMTYEDLSAVADRLVASAAAVTEESGGRIPGR